MDFRITEQPVVEDDSGNQTDRAKEPVKPPEHFCRNHVVDESAEQYPGDRGSEFKRSPEKSQETERHSVCTAAEMSGNPRAEHRTEGHARHRPGGNRSREEQIGNSPPEPAAAAVRAIADDRPEKESDRTRQRSDHKAVEHIGGPVPFEHQLHDLKHGPLLHLSGEITEQQQEKQRDKSTGRVAERADCVEFLPFGHRFTSGAVCDSCH